MTGYEDSVPAYLTVRMTTQEGPIAAFADQEAWRARERYPQLRGVGIAEYFWAQEREAGGWELSEYGGSWPQQARDTLGSHFRLSSQAAEKSGDEAAARKWMAAALRMDREVVNEVRVLGRRFKIVRVSHFIRSGAGGPEPPRPSDPDPGEVGEAYRLTSRTKGFVVDPHIGTGLSDGILKLDILPFAEIIPGGPSEVNDDARRAVHLHPGGVLLPAAFTVCERVDGLWEFQSPGSTSPTPQGARDSLAYWLRVSAPYHLRLSPEKRAEYAEAADRLDASRGNSLSVDGRRFRVTRVERLVRIGPDGPEPPRPSDFDPEPPVEVQTQQLKDEGVIDEDGNDLRPEEPESPRIIELRRLWEEEEARRAAVKARKNKKAPEES